MDSFTRGFSLGNGPLKALSLLTFWTHLKLAALAPVPRMPRSRPQKNSPKHPSATELPPAQMSSLREMTFPKTRIHHPEKVLEKLNNLQVAPHQPRYPKYLFPPACASDTPEEAPPARTRTLHTPRYIRRGRPQAQGAPGAAEAQSPWPPPSSATARAQLRPQRPRGDPPCQATPPPRVTATGANQGAVSSRTPLRDAISQWNEAHGGWGHPPAGNGCRGEP